MHGPIQHSALALLRAALCAASPTGQLRGQKIQVRELAPWHRRDDILFDVLRPMAACTLPLAAHADRPVPHARTHARAGGLKPASLSCAPHPRPLPDDDGARRRLCTRILRSPTSRPCGRVSHRAPLSPCVSAARTLRARARAHTAALCSSSFAKHSRRPPTESRHRLDCSSAPSSCCRPARAWRCQSAVDRRGAVRDARRRWRRR